MRGGKTNHPSKPTNTVRIVKTSGQTNGLRLWRHVVDRAQHHTALRDLRLILDAGDAEVHDLDRTIVHPSHVGWLHVTVNDSLLVSEIEGLAKLYRDVQGLGERDGLFGADQASQIRSLEILHDDVGFFVAAEVPQLVDGHDVRVLELRRRPGFPLEPLARVRVGDGVGGQSLDCHPPVE